MKNHSMVITTLKIGCRILWPHICNLSMQEAEAGELRCSGLALATGEPVSKRNQNGGLLAVTDVNSAVL